MSAGLPRYLDRRCVGCGRWGRSLDEDGRCEECREPESALQEGSDMKKIVINKCSGGFSLSHEAILRYCQLRGWSVYPEQHEEKFASMLGQVYWLVPPEDRPEELPEPWAGNSLEDRKAYNKAYSKATIHGRDIPRDDPFLVRVVEEMEGKANGPHADLGVVQIPDDVEWSIEEYDGTEWVAEQHRTWQ